MISRNRHLYGFQNIPKYSFYGRWIIDLPWYIYLCILIIQMLYCVHVKCTCKMYFWLMHVCQKWLEKKWKKRRNLKNVQNWSLWNEKIYILGLCSLYIFQGVMFKHVRIIRFMFYIRGWCSNIFFHIQGVTKILYVEIRVLYNVGMVCFLSMKTGYY